MLRSIVQHRRGTTNEWSASKVIPKEGEIVIEELDNGTKKIKLGDGETPFKDLPYLSGSGGGGGNGGASLAIRYTTLSPVYCTMNDTVNLKFEFEGTDSSGDAILEADATWRVNDTIVAYSTVVDGANTFDVSNYIEPGEKEVEVEVEDLNGNTTTKSWKIKRVNLSIDSNFNSKGKYEANKELSFSYYPTGAIYKKVLFYLDGTYIGYHEPGEHVSGRDVYYPIPGQSHGSHLIEVYLEGTMENGVKLPKVGPVTRDLIFFDKTNDAPVIGCDTPVLKIKQYETKNIVFTVYDKNADIPEVDIFIDGSETPTTHMIIAANDDYLGTPTESFPYVGTEIGEHEIKIKCRDQEKIIKVIVEKLDVEIAPVTTGLVFDFNPAGKKNSDISNRSWMYSGNYGDIHMRVSDNFDWIHGGYSTDDPDGPCFIIKAGSTAIIDYKLFADEAKINGKEFKLIFKTKNVSNPEATFLSCIDNTTEKDYIGIEMRAQSANIYGKNGNLDVTYSEDDVIEFEFNISKNSEEVPMIMSYEDGVPSRPLVYDSTFSFEQNNPKEIVLGSPDCDLHIYRFKVYNTSLSNIDILNNFIADARTPEELIARHTRNQIYNDDGKLTPESVAESCPWLRVYKVEAPVFTNHKDNKVSNTTITQIYKGGDPVLDNWTCYNAQHSGQGTSSNNYGAAGRNLDFIMNKDNSYFELGDKTRASEITLTRESVPVAYLNAKVNIASSNNLTNAMLANRYNQFSPYRRPFIRPEGYKTEYIKDTMEFHNCVIFIKETDPDMSKHREFADNEWHFYAIGNIGDSKKTDKTRATDKNDPYECCVEIMDVKLPLSDFPVDTMIEAMAQKKNEKEELEYVWAKNENLGILYERTYMPTTDNQINLNKTYYMDLPVKKRATGKQASSENLAAGKLYDRVYVLSEDNLVDLDKTYYKNTNGDVVSKEELKTILSPNRAELYEWKGEYKVSTDSTIIQGKLYFVEVLEKTNAMAFTFETIREYLTAKDENLAKDLLYENIDGNYVLSEDKTIDLTKTYYIEAEELDSLGNVIGVSYIDAMGYILKQIKVYTYAKNENLGILYEFVDGEYKKSADTQIISEKIYYVCNNGIMEEATQEQLTEDNLCKLFEISYKLTEDQEINLNKTYFVDILEHDDFSEDYTYGWRYSSNKKDKNITNFCRQRWIEFYRFVTTSTDEEFKAHLSDYFVLDSALYYYLFTTRYCMVDNRAKNTFWHYGKTADLDANGEQIRKWDLCWDYDNDTSLGLNNYGKQVYRYGLEDIDVDASGEEVFREMDSLFFCRIRDLFGPELKKMYKDLEDNNAWHAESFIKECDTWQDEFPEELWRLDIERKYIRSYNTSFINGGGDNQFLVNMCNGRMKYQRRQWERNQEQYMSSKYQTTRASGDNYSAVFRFGGPSSQVSSLVVPANYQLTLTPYSYMYLNVQYGDTSPSTVRVTEQNINTPITVPFYGNAADIVKVFNAASIRDFGDLSAAYPKTVSIGNASRVKTLTLGNANSGYDNSVFTTLTTESNTLLEELDVTNISTLKQVLDLRKLTSLKKIKAFGTKTPSVLFADGGKLNYAELPAVNSINLKNLSYISSENFVLEDYSNVTDLIVENCPLIDKVDLLNKCANLLRLRLTDVNLGTVTYDYFEEKLFKLKGIAANGEDTIDNAWITGECYFEELTGEQYNEINRRYPELTIKFGTLHTKVVFMDIDGETELLSVNLTAENSQPISAYYGNIPTPQVIAPSKKYSYIPDGWTTKKVLVPQVNTPEYTEFKAPEKEIDALKNILGYRFVYPAFINDLKKYEVRFYNPSRTGDELLQVVETFYGYTAEYTADIPNKKDTTKPENYEFVGWDRSIQNITGPVEFYAQFNLLDSAWYTLKPEDMEYTINSNNEIELSRIKDTLTETVIDVPSYFVLNDTIYPITVIGTKPRPDSAAVNGCFEYSKTIEYVRLPNTVTTIKQQAFNGCEALLSVRLPDSLTYIGTRAFTSCKLLSSIRIPKNVSYIATQSLSENASLTNIEVDPENKTFYVKDGCLIKLEINGNEDVNRVLIAGVPNCIIPYGVVKIAPHAFYYSSITNINFPDSIKEIGDSAFAHCESLTDVILPANCKLGYTTFAWCYKLANITLPTNLTEIKSYVFEQCCIESLVIPSKIKSISARAFGNIKTLKNVTFLTTVLPDSDNPETEVNEAIDVSAFYNTGHTDGLTINVPWSENDVLGAPWGAINATINYNYIEN